jgi:hypothetical protein
LTAFFIFELRTTVESEEIQNVLSSVWKRSGYGEVEVTWWELHKTFRCEALYFFADDLDCRNRIEEMLRYLFSVAIDGRIYYYRFSEATNYYFKSPQKLTLDDLFSEYYPTLGGYCIRYELQRLKSKVQETHETLP